MNNRQVYCDDCRQAAKKEIDDAWRARNVERDAENKRKWAAENLDKANAIKTAWAKANRTQVAKTKQNWQAGNAEKARAACRRYYESNLDAMRERKRLEMREKLKDPVFALNARISTSVRESLDGKKGRRKWESLVGYTLAALKLHLERQFTAGMSWQNRGQWHIDHIVAQSRFHFTGAEDPEFLACWALPNLRPIWAGDNLSKSDKLTHLL